MEQALVRAYVLEIVEARGMILAVLQLVTGDVAIGMIISDSINRWRVAGLSTTPPEAWDAGKRGVSLQPLDGRVAPEIGAEMTEVQDPAARPKELP